MSFVFIKCVDDENQPLSLQSIRTLCSLVLISASCDPRQIFNDGLFFSFAIIVRRRLVPSLHL